jgi:hypothetical protein
VRCALGYWRKHRDENWYGSPLRDRRGSLSCDGHGAILWVFQIPLGVNYSPGVIRWAVVVPAFMIQTPPDLLLSGNPVDCIVAPGTAMVMWVRV